MLTKYGVDNIIIMLLLSVMLIILGILVPKTWLTVVFLAAGIILAAFTFWFFRDPDRNIPDEAKKDFAIVLAPADGKVIEIKEITDTIFLKSSAIQISIFLSPLDVHVNRIPVSGVIKYFKYHPGEYLIAFNPKSSDKNEQTHIGVENEFGKILFKQIVGILARRLVWDIKEGDTVQAGNRFGMMKFGSRMDVIIDVKSEIFVKEGDKIVAGETIIARMAK